MSNEQKSKRIEIEGSYGYVTLLDDGTVIMTGPYGPEHPSSLWIDKAAKQLTRWLKAEREPKP